MVNDRHLSGVSTPADPPADSSYGPHGSPYGQSAYGYQGSQDTPYGYVTGTSDALGAAYGDGDPLFGAMPGDTSQASADQRFPSGDGWTGDTGQHAVYDNHPAGSWTQAPAQPAESPDGGGHGWAETGYGTGVHTGPAVSSEASWTGDAGQHAVYDNHPAGSWDDSGSYPAVEPEAGDGQAHGEYTDYGRHGEYTEYTEYDRHTEYGEYTGYAGYDAHSSADTDGTGAFPAPEPEPGHGPDESADSSERPGASDPFDLSGPAGPEEREEDPRRSGPSARPARPAGSRRRRSARPKRSALLTVAVPSVCVMGVTAVAAASVSNVGDEAEDTTAQAAPDAASAVKSKAANSKLDTQLAGLSDEAEGFADRASRTQERIDLKERQEAERKRKAAEAARKEAMRPKFALPVVQQGLSAYYGQAGINWMSLHTGLDFPVAYGTPVMAATDGTVRTQWNSAYGNMAIVTAPDGTETWYCHLSSTRIRSGYVKAGDTIAYSGNSGNSTGPHLHFEVRPAGGAAIDPLPWFRAKGLDPT
ncbi:M23 family metallopeptidase [Streptomyces pini]|uniref:Murein DD-endopeptidase MepM and murein hydrolase activator NlpD, contain LysM domain n=1 Tax=Streptomyces pini TaxID=1520580 RepID=A0A1I4G6I9_9ACTN|nr:Murein DD-endopeptidase MepM and murein hydrolase activator NlpD, contain LysM domain [Streptomyces pini]